MFLNLVKEEHWEKIAQNIYYTLSELYQYILQPKDNGCLPGLRYWNVNTILSDIVLRYLMPIHIRQIIERHKVMCGCETCIYENSLH